MSTSIPQSTQRRRSAVKVALWLGIGAVILVLAGYFGVSGLAANLLTMPRRDFSTAITPAHMGLAYEDVRFPARDGAAEIAGWFIPAADAAPVIVMVHGRDASRTAAVGGNFLQEAQMLHAAGFGVLMIDLRGHGESSDARFTFGLKERYDVLGAVDWLRAQGVEPGHIGVLGLSLGAAAAIAAAAEEPAIGALVTDSVFADLNGMINEQWEQASGLPRPFLSSALLMAQLLTGKDLTQAQPVRDLPRVTPMPVLLIHCAADDYVPATNLDQLKAAYPNAETWKFEGAACLHSEGFNVDPARYVRTVADFFAASLP